MVDDGVRRVEPEHRHTGLVFQEHALFPHLTVADNIAFGLRGLARGRTGRARATTGSSVDRPRRPRRPLPARAVRRRAPARRPRPRAGPASRGSCCSTSRSPASTRTCGPAARRHRRRPRARPARRRCSSPTIRPRRCRSATASPSCASGRIEQVGDARRRVPPAGRTASSPASWARPRSCRSTATATTELGPVPVDQTVDAGAELVVRPDDVAVAVDPPQRASRRRSSPASSRGRPGRTRCDCRAAALVLATDASHDPASHSATGARFARRAARRRDRRRTVMRFLPYHRLEGRPNVIVDGSPTDGTVLTVTHWPGYPPPASCRRRPVGADGVPVARPPRALRRAELVSNNHFDQDGLVSSTPWSSRTRRWPAGLPRGRRRRPATSPCTATADAARVSMVLAASPRDGASTCPWTTGADRRSTRELLGRLPELSIASSGGVRCGSTRTRTWRPERRAIAGRGASSRSADVDLAVVDVPASLRRAAATASAAAGSTGLHPMAVPTRPSASSWRPSAAAATRRAALRVLGAAAPAAAAPAP